MSNFRKCFELIKINKRVYVYLIVSLGVMLIFSAVTSISAASDDDLSLSGMSTMAMMVSACCFTYSDILAGCRVTASSEMRRYIITRFSVFSGAAVCTLFFLTDILFKLIGCAFFGTSPALHLSSTAAGAAVMSIVIISLALSYINKYFSLLIFAGYLTAFYEMISQDISFFVYEALGNALWEIIVSTVLLAVSIAFFSFMRCRKYNSISSNACRQLTVQDNTAAEMFGVK